MDENKIKILKKLIKKERSLEYLTEMLDLTTYEIMGIINYLKEKGNNVSVIKKEGEIYITNFGDMSIEENEYVIETPNKVIKLALISDTRLGSKYGQLSLLNDVYKRAEEFGADTVLHLGDISEGEYRGKKSIYNDSLFAHGIDEQCEYILEHYPLIDGIKTYFLTGEHDLTHINGKNTRDIGKMIEKERSDMIYLGQNQCELRINKLKFYLEHMTSNRATPLTVSYRPQESMRVMRSEDKDDFFFQGHNFQSQAFTMRDIKCITVPSLVATTPEMKNKASYNTVGAWFVEITTDAKGNIIGHTKLSSPYYKTIDGDYKKAKVLRRTK